MTEVLIEKEVAAFKELVDSVKSEMGKVVVGQKRTIDLLLITLFSRGHALFVGVPGVGKTLIVSTLARVLDLDFKRVQFTPDLLPGDITGTEIVEEDRATGGKVFRFVQGPVFTNILLADEINRSPPKTQSALLEAMQEKRVTVYGKNYILPDPFHVFATQNPIEHEGTYPLPEAQLDRFMMEIDMEYPSEEEEKDIIKLTTTGEVPSLNKILTPENILKFQSIVLNLPLPELIVNFIVSLIRATRPETTFIDEVKEFVEIGIGPRGGQFLSLGSKVRALMYGRVAPSIEDVINVAVPILKHRLIMNFKGRSEGISSDIIISKIIDYVKKEKF